MPVWLVSGASGFLGRHLLGVLGPSPGPGVEVVAIGRRLPEGWPPDAFLPADLEDPPSLRRAVASARPEVVFHLGGRTPPADAASFYRSNVGGTAALLDALDALGAPCRVVAAGSAAELGPVPASRLPVDERTPCRPEGPYGLSKWFASRLTAARLGPVEGIVARVFNPIGPGTPGGQAFGRFAAALAEPGPDPRVLRTGNLDARRDFIDARDVASALVALALRGRAGRIYPVGTGVSRSIAEGLDRLIALSGLRVTVEAGSNPSGPTDSRADLGAMTRDTGWAPRIGFEESLADLWRSVADRRITAPSVRVDPGSTAPGPAGGPIARRDVSRSAE
ncbi:NAD-dependent epimerase/dehydratase family protein [Tautonia plasticadhaerens]|uniref:GDP-6-deoxy-D-mannose reductase n=1 Tax=Tautonia plasticadhaerens TaxID=2527974 RepID=A0A518H554_9BACT|nr:NAD-dependent epimerase/dehydratase family protein [Tautonia plasticadhaerens]QDV35974.1 GDP-6-deoxy-D-mannose reductase [Tautonia plasticadhaerens]